MGDLLNIVLAVVVAEMTLLILSLPNAFFHLPITGIGRRVFIMDGFFTLAFVAGLRISKRLYLEVIREKGTGRKAPYYFGSLLTNTGSAFRLSPSN